MTHARVATCSVLLLLLLATLPSFAGPKPKKGNNGVPNLLAEIAELEIELASTREELASTQETLAATESGLIATSTQLTLTQTSLTSTQSQLSLTQSNLGVTEALLDESLEALEREQNRYRVPQTGQDFCWSASSEAPDDAHSTVPCASTGQDGEYDAGLAPPFNRFVDNGNGTITDRFTELVWLKDAGCRNNYAWIQAVVFGRLMNGSVNVCGLQDQSLEGDWRLPNIRELMSLLDFRKVPRFPIDLAPFESFGGWYWTSTTYALDPDTSPEIRINTKTISTGYGGDNWIRFNDAYIVNITTGEVSHTPKSGPNYTSVRHEKSPGLVGPGESETWVGFESGVPQIPQPAVIIVRDLKDGE